MVTTGGVCRWPAAARRRSRSSRTAGVDEKCHAFDECEFARPFVDVGKRVFNAECATKFVDDPHLVRPTSQTVDLRTLILPLDLDGTFRSSCDDR